MKKISFKYKEQPVEISLTKSSTSITNSHKIRKSVDMLNILEEARSTCSKYYAIHHRSIFGMVNEWRVHNLLYSLNIMKNRTSTVDLQLKQNIVVKIFYTLLSFLYFWEK